MFNEYLEDERYIPGSQSRFVDQLRDEERDKVCIKNIS